MVASLWPYFLAHPVCSSANNIGSEWTKIYYGFGRQISRGFPAMPQHVIGLVCVGLGTPPHTGVDKGGPAPPPVAGQKEFFC